LPLKPTTSVSHSLIAHFEKGAAARGFTKNFTRGRCPRTPALAVRQAGGSIHSARFADSVDAPLRQGYGVVFFLRKNLHPRAMRALDCVPALFESATLQLLWRFACCLTTCFCIGVRTGIDFLNNLQHLGIGR
jgi:hypothetical protein